jgi:hypothetical protein
VAEQEDIRRSSDGPMTTADLARAGQEPADQGGRAADVQTDDRPASLFPENEVGDLRHQWDAVQTGFVDEPRRAVESADALVASAMQRLAETFAEERAQLEAQWDRGDDVSTEDLRLALQRYRAFFGRLLSV